MVGEDVGHFGTTVLLVSLAMVAALAANRLSTRIRIPTPALFLLGAAVASDVWPALGQLSGRVDERLVTVALVLVLFDRGMGIGWRRFRSAAGPVLWIGIAGTVVTAGGMALAAHLLFGFGWQAALLLGTALAPTDPAVVFSVLSGREIAGRTGTMLEGESGANDPVGIALLVSVAGAGGGGLAAVGSGLGEFGLQMAVGVAVGIVGGLGLRWLVVNTQLPNESLYPLRALAGAAVLYGAAAALDGSGFLAVFIAGILLGDADAPFKARGQPVQLRGRQPRRDRRVHDPRADGLAADRGDRARPADRAGTGRHPDLRRPPGAGRGPAAADPAAGQRTDLRAVGRAEGRRADPARPFRARREPGRQPAGLPG